MLLCGAVYRVFSHYRLLSLTISDKMSTIVPSVRTTCLITTQAQQIKYNSINSEKGFFIVILPEYLAVSLARDQLADSQVSDRINFLTLGVKQARTVSLTSCRILTFHQSQSCLQRTS